MLLLFCWLPLSGSCLLFACPAFLLSHCWAWAGGSELSISFIFWQRPQLETEVPIVQGSSSLWAVLFFPQPTKKSNCANQLIPPSGPDQGTSPKWVDGPAAKGFTPRSGCSPQGLDVPPRGGEAKAHSPPWAIPGALAHLFHQLCSAEPVPSVPAGPLGAEGGTGGFWGAALGFCPSSSPQLYALGGCISCVSKPPSCPRNSHNLLCVFLAQKRLIHSLKQINYFCYLEKRKKKINPLELVGLTFNCVHNAVKQICSEAEKKSSRFLQ